MYLLMALLQAPVGDSTHIPDFSITLVDGRQITKAQLKRHAPLMIVYYSPTCEHCQHFGQDLAAHLARFKGVQIVMVTFRPVSEVADFIHTCHLEHSSALIGSEGLTFTVAKYYGVQRFPFIVVYDRQGALRKIFRDPPGMDALHEALFGGTASGLH